MNLILVNVWMDAVRGGGTAERTRHLALHLSQLGCNCTILTMGINSWRDELERAGVKIVGVPFLGSRFPIPLISYLSLFRLIKQADVVLVMGFWFLLAPAVCVTAYLAQSPLVLCPAGSLTRFGRSTLLKRFYYWTVGRWMLRTATTVMATTGQEKELLITDCEATADSIFISPNGIDPPVSLNTMDVSLPKGRIVLFIGRLTAIKAPDLLLEAFASVVKEIPDARLVFVGPDFGLRLQLEKQVIALGLQVSVHFAGYAGERQRTALLEKAELLVVPSHSEVMSLVALEAGAMGVPVIITDQCGFNEVAEIDGGLVVSANRFALTEAIVRLMSDPASLKEKGLRLQLFVLKTYAWRKVATELLATLNRIRTGFRG